MVCCNLCISTDGFSAEIRVTSYKELQNKIIELITSYNVEKHLNRMQRLEEYNLRERQFAQLIGRLRLYQYLPKKEKKALPEILINDGQISSVAKDYYRDDSFCRNENGDINLWKVYNLLTSANKSSYIDTFLDRGCNVFNFTHGLQTAISGSSNHSWFLS